MNLQAERFIIKVNRDYNRRACGCQALRVSDGAVQRVCEPDVLEQLLQEEMAAHGWMGTARELHLFLAWVDSASSPWRHGR